MTVRGVRRRVAGVAGAALAAAAALFVALHLPEPTLSNPTRPEPIRGGFEVLVGETKIYHVDSGVTELVEVEEPKVDPDDYFAVLGSRGLGDEYFAMLGYFEMMTEPLMASAEDESGPFDPLTP